MASPMPIDRILDIDGKGSKVEVKVVTYKANTICDNCFNLVEGVDIPFGIEKLEFFKCFTCPLCGCEVHKGRNGGNDGVSPTSPDLVSTSWRRQSSDYWDDM